MAYKCPIHHRRKKTFKSWVIQNKKNNFPLPLITGVLNKNYKKALLVDHQLLLPFYYIA